MSVVIVTGSGGLIGSEAVRRFIAEGYVVVGIDNDYRSAFFGAEASTAWMAQRLLSLYPGRFESEAVDICSDEAVSRIFAEYRGSIAAVIHCAAQPSHDWAARNPKLDFRVNATGTLNLLDATLRYAPSAPFVFCSTNKVYGDRPNSLPLGLVGPRLDLSEDHPLFDGIDETMSIDQTRHSVFGASKVAADVMVQEYGRYFGLRTVCFRGGCLTGPDHSGAKLHGFLSYLVRCAVRREPYEVIGYEGLQVRDNIHSADFIEAVVRFVRDPTSAAVFNIGGGRENSCSVLEAIDLVQSVAGLPLRVTFNRFERAGDHRWWITDLRPLQRAYPGWGIKVPLPQIVEEAVHAARGRV